MRKTITSTLCVIAAIVIWGTSSTRVHAQENPAGSSGLAVSPPTFEITGNPGDTITNTVRVENTSTRAIRMAVDKRNFTAVGEEGGVGITEEENNFSLASWISVDPTEITLQPHAFYTFNFTIRVPLTAEPGGHFGSLIFRTIPTQEVTGSGASLAQELGSLILLRIAGPTTEEASIQSFEAAKNIYEFGPVDLVARVENQGNVHLKTTGTVTVTNMLGQKVATFPLESKNVLPDAIRKLNATWDTKWRMGRYTATAVIIYGRSSTQRAAVTNFYVIPYRMILAVLLVVGAIGVAIYHSRKRIALALRILFTGKS